MRNAALLTTLTFALALTGCGKSPTAATPSRSALTMSRPVAPPAPIVASGYITPQQLLPGVRQAQQAQQGFSGTINTWEKGPDGKKSSETMNVWWKRPNTLKIDIVKGDSSSQGVVAAWDGSDNIKVKPSYMPFSVSLPITDTRIKSANGWTIKQTDVSAMLNVLLDPAAQLQSLGPQVIDGKSVFLLGVQSSKSPQGVTKEQIGIDMQLNLPVVRLLYKGDNLVYKLVATNFHPGVPSDSNLSI